MKREEDKLFLFANLAMDLGRLTTCRKRQVGCVITSLDFMEVLGIGFNGQAVNEGHCPGGDPCGCLHAEANALIKMRYPAPRAQMFLTCPPCLACAGLILNKQCILRVYLVGTQAASREGVKRLLKGGVCCFEYSLSSKSCRVAKDT